MQGILWYCEYEVTHAYNALLLKFFLTSFPMFYSSDQCEDRLYRLGQKKDVDIAYHDVPLTIDDLMRTFTLSTIIP